MSVNTEVRESARTYLIAYRIGLLSIEEMQSWADDQIRRLKEPPDFVFVMSAGDLEELNFVDRLDLVKDRPNDLDLAPIAAEILDRLGSGMLDFEKLELIALASARLLDVDLACWAAFDWISDELYLVSEGVKEKDSSYREICAQLERITS